MYHARKVRALLYARTVGVLITSSQRGGAASRVKTREQVIDEVIP